MRAHTEALSIAESRRLIELEKVIKRGKQQFVDVGTALAEIRDLKLYKSDFKTFEDYCHEKWGWQRRYVYNLIEASSVVESLPANVRNCAQTESQARELSKVEPERRVEVLEKAKESGKVTARSIREAAAPVVAPEALTATPPPIVSVPPVEVGGVNVRHYFALQIEERIDESVKCASVEQLQSVALALESGLRKVRQVIKAKKAA